ncbi:MAG: ExbD/TolR family protein [Pirellulaceae bacterium]
MRSPKLLASGTATINMTPMIDVVFLLIIFFLVSSHLAKQENSVKLDLPEAVSALDDGAQRATFVVNVLADGAWQVGGRPLSRAELGVVLEQRVRQDGDKLRLKIRTDREVPYRRLEPVLLMAAQQGLGDIVFSVYEDMQSEN